MPFLAKLRISISPQLATRPSPECRTSLAVKIPSLCPVENETFVDLLMHLSAQIERTSSPASLVFQFGLARGLAALTAAGVHPHHQTCCQGCDCHPLKLPTQLQITMY